VVVKAIILSFHTETSTNTHYSRIILKLGNQVTFAKPEAGEAGSQRCERTAVPTIPLGIGYVAGSTQNTNVH